MAPSIVKYAIIHVYAHDTEFYAWATVAEQPGIACK